MLLTPAFLVIAGLLVIAGAGKLREPAGARAALGLVGMPAGTGSVRALGAGEAVLGLYAALRGGAVGATLLAGVYLGFALFVVRLLGAAERPVGCGCFGDAETGAGWPHVALNLLAAAVALAAVAAPAHGLGWLADRSPMVSAAAIAGVAAALYAAYLVFTELPRAWRAAAMGPGG